MRWKKKRKAINFTLNRYKTVFIGTYTSCSPYFVAVWNGGKEIKKTSRGYLIDKVTEILNKKIPTRIRTRGMMVLYSVHLPTKPKTQAWYVHRSYKVFQSSGVTTNTGNHKNDDLCVNQANLTTRKGLYHENGESY